mgnify:CR=1 FL=1
MKNTYRLEKIDPLTYTEEDWNSYYEFRTQTSALKNVPMPFASMDALKQFDLKNIKENGEERYQVWKNDQANGIFLFDTEFEDDLEKRFTNLNNYMVDKYLAPNLLEMVFKQFLDYDEKSNALAIQSTNKINDFVADVYNVRTGSISELSELNVKEANMEKIDAWLAEAPAKFPNLRIKFYRDIPDDLLEEYAAFFTQMIEDLPANSELGDAKITVASIKTEQELGNMGNYCSYRYLIFNEANQLIAKTNVMLDLKEPQVMDQYMTGVMKEYRGRGLSKWLKASMFKKLMADFPTLEKIKTDTHPENHASRELSKQMGYKMVGIEKNFLIDRSVIVQHLNANA